MIYTFNIDMYVYSWSQKLYNMKNKMLQIVGCNESVGKDEFRTNYTSPAKKKKIPE